MRITCVQSQAARLRFEITMERKSINYMIKAFTMHCSDLHPRILHHGTSVNLFRHQTTHLTYQAMEMAMRALLGMAELQFPCSGRAFWRYASGRGHPDSEQPVLATNWKAFFLRLHLPVDSHFHPRPSKACFITRAAGRLRYCCRIAITLYLYIPRVCFAKSYLTIV